MAYRKLAAGEESWASLRWRVLCRDNHECQYCEPPRRRRAEHADHIIPRKLGGPDADWNLVAACGFCNISKGAHLIPPRWVHFNSPRVAVVKRLVAYALRQAEERGIELAI